MSDLPKLPVGQNFLCGSIAACIAVTFTNPMEVAKTRLQLDGELAKKGKARVYTSLSDVIVKTYKTEGIRGLQRGLLSAYAFQGLMNGARLGLYDPIKGVFDNALHVPKGVTSPISTFASGALTGMIGSVLSSPVFLVKARLQAYSPSNPTGQQHEYRGLIDGIVQIMRKQGPKGLFQGTAASVVRTTMGSTVQLPAYNFAKYHLLNNFGMSVGIPLYFLSSSFSGVCVLLTMQPFDTALTRLYNQSPNSVRPDGSRGLLYNGLTDCLIKTLKSEGLSGLYKGSTAHFFRIAPHTVLMLMANEYVVRTWVKIRDGDIKEA